MDVKGGINKFVIITIIIIIRNEYYYGDISQKNSESA